jgi:patatin-like phospholipase/acyl hydrolase
MVAEELPLLDDPRRRILAICGGGYAGLFAAEFLSRLENHLGGKALGNHFDLIAGTSIGGLLALGLASGLRAAALPAMLTDLGPLLFRKASYGLFRSKYNPAPLSEKITSLFGNGTLTTLQRQVLIPAVNMTACEALIFGNGKNDPTAVRTIHEAAMATSAAPWFLPPHASDHRLYADGGLVANSPECAAAIEAVHGRCWPRDRLTMLVVGATRANARTPGHLLGTQWGLLGWVKKKRLLDTVMQAQMSLAAQLSRRVLGKDNVVDVNVELNAEEQEHVGLDTATPKATATLQTLAKEAFEKFRREYPTMFDR